MTPPRRTESRYGQYSDTSYKVAVTPEEEGEALTWDEWRKVTVYYKGQSHDYRVKAVQEETAKLLIATERMKHTHLCEEVRGAIINAVSMNTMPVVDWA